MFISLQEDALRSVSPAVSPMDENDDPILYRHDSSTSTDATATEALEKELDSSRRTEAVITQQCIEFLEKKTLLEKNVQQKKREKTDRKIDRPKERRKPNNELEAEIQHLREEKDVGAGELEELEIVGHVNIPVDCNPTMPPKLGFSPIITGAYITPVQAEDAHQEIEDLIQRLSTVEVKNERLLSNYTKLSDSHRELLIDFDAEVEYTHAIHETNLRLTAQIEDLISQLEAQAQLLRTKDQQTEQQVAQARAELTAEHQARIDALEMQRQRTYSIFSDPDFVVSLQRSRASTFSLSRPPTPTIPCSDPHCSQFADNAAPKVILNITLRPSDAHLWSLLRNIKRSLFWTSLNIEGPQDLAREFLASMEAADREFEEQGQRVARLERVVAERGEVIGWLRRWWRR